jgi:hypothetical protein
LDYYKKRNLATLMKPTTSRLSDESGSADGSRGRRVPLDVANPHRAVAPVLDHGAKVDEVDLWPSDGSLGSLVLPSALKKWR